MKRISIAEQTLKKQIEQFKMQRSLVFAEIRRLEAQTETYHKIIDDMEIEQNKLRQIREAHKEPHS